MTTTSIEWVRGSDGIEGKSWNPMRGCSIVSRECQRCYAQSIARRFSGPGKPFAGLINRHGKWNGVMRKAPERTLYEPLSWRKPTRVFVNSMTDLFHENADDWWIDEIFAVMACCPQHTFIVLTKRAERMRSYCTSEDIEARLDCLANDIIDERIDPNARRTDDLRATANVGVWPLPNVILGVSCGLRESVGRIDRLRETPAAARLVSFEPLLEDVGTIDFSGIGWAIVGGESGPGAAPMHPNWARSLRDQCMASRVPFFFKQWGDWSPSCNTGLHGNERRKQVVLQPYVMYRLGKKAAGRMLDGREWDEFPEMPQ